MSPPWLPAAFLIVPGLLALTLLMAWLELTFTHRLVKHEVAVAWSSATTPEEVEAAVTRSLARVLLR
jgi:siroheme synthase